LLYELGEPSIFCELQRRFSTPRAKRVHAADVRVEKVHRLKTSGALGVEIGDT